MSISILRTTTFIVLAGMTSVSIGCRSGDTPSAVGPGETAGEHRIYLPEQIEWKDSPPSLPGVKMAVLDGDPTKAGPFCMRLRLPDGYRVMPHWHPMTERVTVLSGTLQLGFGDTFDASKTHALPTGTFGYWTPGVHHFAYAQGETVLQLNSVGPWKLIYVNPADDPSNTSSAR
jgi:hypothetical protein